MSGNGKNVLLITSDQQHWNTLGILNPEVKTPNLDRLARQGTLFTRSYCVNPTCTPTRASIITGMYPSQHGAYSLGTKLPESVPTVGDDFQANGYRTALVGKAHFQQTKSTDEYPSLESLPIIGDLDYWRKFHGPFYGFERVELARNHADEHLVGQHYAVWMEEKGLKDWRKHFRSPENPAYDPDNRTWTIPEEYHYDAWIAEKSNELLEQYAENQENFFLWSSFFDPHPRYLVPEPWDKMYDPAKVTLPSVTEGEHDKNPPHFKLTQEEKPDFSSYQEPDGNGCHGFASHLRDDESMRKNIATYYGMITLMDKYIGKILDKLEELGLADDTMIVFTTDHGHFYGHHGLVAKGPFHYEDMIKIPHIVKMPDAVPTGQTSEALQSSVDLAPTFLSVAGIDVPRRMTGVDQKAVWFGEKKHARDHVLVENRHQPTTINHRTYVDDRYKLTVYYNQDCGELFDLRNDPGEIDNLWDNPEHADLKRDLFHKMLNAEMAREPLPMPRVSGA